MSDLLELAQETVRRADRRVDAFAAKYAPILAKLSETEFTGLTQAVVTEAARRTVDSKRRLVIENAPGLIGESLRRKP